MNSKLDFIVNAKIQKLKKPVVPISVKKEVQVVKLCAECKYARTNVSGFEFAKCAHHMCGARLSDGVAQEYCDYLRNNNNKCGRIGRYWEHKKNFLKKLWEILLEYHFLTR